MTSDEAWAALIAANQEEDLDDFKVFFLEYVRNNKELTFVDMEKKFRDEGLGVYLIAIVLSHPKHFIFPPYFQSDVYLGKGNSSTKNNPQSSRRNWEKISRFFPTWTQKSSYSVSPSISFRISL